MHEVKKWEKLESKYLIKRPWLTARCDTVKMPNGIVNDEYYVLEYPDWINVIGITDDNKMLMIQQYRHGIEEIHYELVAGVIDPSDATPLAAAKRELLEETGYGDGEWKEYMLLSPNCSTNSNRCHTFLATGIRQISAPHLEPTEDIAIHLFSQEEAFSLLQKGEIVQSLMAAPLWRYFYECYR